MRIAVIGGSGRTGRIAVEELLRRGHEVTVLARNPEAVQAPPGAVRVVTGDCRDDAALAELVEGSDAVVSALGPTAREPTLHRQTAAALVTTLRSAGTRRFVGVSGAGLDVPGDRKSLRDRVISRLVQRLGGELPADKRAEFDVWSASDLDWTLVRPPRLTDGPGTGSVEHHAHHSTRATSISRRDLAVFLVGVVERDLHVKEAPFVARA